MDDMRQMMHERELRNMSKMPMGKRYVPRGRVRKCDTVSRGQVSRKDMHSDTLGVLDDNSDVSFQNFACPPVSPPGIGREQDGKPLEPVEPFIPYQSFQVIGQRQS